MDDSKFLKEIKAVRALHRLMADAQTCKRLHEEAGLPLPRPLVALFHPDEPLEDRKASPPPELVEIPRPLRPVSKPRGCTDEWIYFPVEEAQETSLVLAALSTYMAITPSEIIKGIQSFRPHVNIGTIANIGSRLEQEGLIRRDHKGWILIPGTLQPEIAGNHIWGIPGVFQKQELAAYRRTVILHVLRSFSSGLQVAQLTRTLEAHCPWLSDDIPVTKFLVKADIEALADKKLVKKIGGTKKWGVA